MRVTALGHGGYSVQMNQLHLLFDPVLVPTFADGTREVFPPREVALANLPKVDAVFLSHDHDGHFDIPTLCLIPRTTHVFYPPSEAVEMALDAMGFQSRTLVEAGQEIAFDGKVLTPTAGAEDGLHGLLIQDGTSSCWLMDDQGSTRAAVASVRRAAPTLDFVACSYPGLKYRYFGNNPPDESPLDSLARCLEAVTELSPSLACPGAPLFRFLGDLDWLNRYVFTMSREQFSEHLTRLVPGQRTAVLRPGDEVILRDGGAEVRSQASAFVRATDKQTHNNHEPMRAIPHLVDSNPEQLSAETLATRADAYLRGPFLAWLREAVRAPGSRQHVYQQLGLTCRIRVVLPGGSELSWLITLGSRPPTIIAEGVSDLLPSTTLEHAICASALDRWRRAVISHATASFYSRSGGVVLGAARLPSGRVTVEDIGRADLLTEHLIGNHFDYLRAQITQHTS